MLKPLSTARPSTWWKTGVWVASSSSVRYTRPGTPRRPVAPGRATFGSAAARCGCADGAAVRRTDEERVLHGARRVVAVDVQRVEVEPLGFEFGSLDDAVPDGDEGVRDVLADGVDRVAGADRLAVVEHRDVDPFGGEDALALRLLEFGLPRLQRLVDGPACGPDRLAGLSLRAGWEGTDLTVGQRQRRAVSRVLDPDLLEGRQVGSVGDGRKRMIDLGLQVGGVERGGHDRVEVLVGSGHPSILLVGHNWLCGCRMATCTRTRSTLETTSS